MGDNWKDSGDSGAEFVGYRGRGLGDDWRDSGDSGGACVGYGRGGGMGWAEWDGMGKTEDTWIPFRKLQCSVPMHSL